MTQLSTDAVVELIDRKIRDRYYMMMRHENEIWLADADLRHLLLLGSQLGISRVELLDVLSEDARAGVLQWTDRDIKRALEQAQAEASESPWGRVCSSQKEAPAYASGLRLLGLVERGSRSG